MDKIEMLDFFEQAFQKTVLPEFKQMEGRFDKVDSSIQDFYQKFDYIFKELERLGIEYLMIRESLKRIESSLENKMMDRDSLKNEIILLKSNIQILSHRVEELEKRIP